MGFFARWKFTDSLSKKSKRSTPPLPPAKDKRQQQNDDAPLVVITGSPKSKQPSIAADGGIVSSSPRKPVKSKPGPLAITAQEPQYTTVAVQGDETPLHRPDSLVSSSLVTPRTPRSVSAARHRQLIYQDRVEQHTEQAKGSSADLSDEIPSYDSGVSLPSRRAAGASRLLRRASEKVTDFSLSRPSSRTADRYDDLLETIGRSLPGASNTSVATLASTRSFTPRSGGAELQYTKSCSQDHFPSTGKSVWRRSRALSVNSSKNTSPALPSPASFPHSFPRSNSSQAEDYPVDSPSTPKAHNDQQLHFPPSSPLTDSEDAAVPHRRRKLSKKSLRPSTANGVAIDPIQLCMLRLAPPPRGLAADGIEDRKNMVYQYVQDKLLEDKRRAVKALSRRSTTSNAGPLTVEGYIEKLEDEFQRFMEEDIKDDLDAQEYKELHLADVFIEARRDLGIESMSMRLHSMFDMSQMQVSHATALEARRDAREMEPPSTSPPPPSAWETNRRKHSSLTPAPRKKRRPKTTANDFSHSVDDLNTEVAPFKITLSSEVSSVPHPDSNGSLVSSADGSSTLHHGNADEKAALYRHNPASLPPSPPKSIDSHHYAEVVPLASKQLPPAPPTNQDNTNEISHRPVLSEVLAL
jgi:hypothetical protein